MGHEVLGGHIEVHIAEDQIPNGPVFKVLHQPHSHSGLLVPGVTGDKVIRSTIRTRHRPYAVQIKVLKV